MDFVKNSLDWVALQCRTVAVALLSGRCRRFGFHEIEDRVLALPSGQRAGIIGATLALMIGASMIAAQFGLLGMAVIFAAVVFLVG